ncbi:divalent metal cation transporter [Patescibacteria group bacterium]|nr:divalent metal cation transporter [Patescibacteria group bacterium]MBU4099155.1 divalent metal cation transporter [Patescibacteria group bacterium]
MQKGFLKKIVIFFSVLGPSIITTMAGNDGAGVITYSFAGARLGYTALFILPIVTILYGLTQEMGSRVAIVTGKGLGDLIRERFGVRVAMLIFITIIIANFGTLLTNVAALKVASEMLSIPSAPFILVTVALCFLLVTFTEYDKSQKIFLTGIIFYLAYIFSAIMSNPNWGESTRSLFTPQKSMLSQEYFILAIAIIGTTITPWGQFFVQSYMKDKNVPISRLRYAKIEAYLGAFISNFFSFFIIIATAATLFAHKIPLDSGEKAALAIKPFAGELAGLLFAGGLINASIIGIIIISLTSAYAFSEFFGFTGSLDEPYKKGKPFYLNFLLAMLIPTVLVLTPFFPLFKIVLYTQSLNGILLPIFFYFLLKIVNDSELMGKYVNGKLYNIFSVIAIITIALTAILAVIFSLYKNFT